MECVYKVPSISYYIHQMNQNSSNPRINLVGLSIGDGMMDPRTCRRMQLVDRNALLISSTTSHDHTRAVQ